MGLLYIRVKYKKLYFLLPVVLMFSSCTINSPKYYHTYTSLPGLDLREGKWLINLIEAPDIVRKISMEEKMLKQFKKMGVDSVFAVRDQYFDYIEPGQFSYELDSVTLELLKRTTSFDYIVCVKAVNQGPKTIEGAINLYAPPHEKRALVEIAVYNIHTGVKFYGQTSTGVIKRLPDSQNDNWGPTIEYSNGDLIYATLKKSLKELKKTSYR